MPTPTGMLKAGDKIRGKDDGRVYEVVKREGNDPTYSVILKPVDGKPTPGAFRRVTGYPSDHWRLLEAGYWLGRTFDVLHEGTLKDPSTLRIESVWHHGPNRHEAKDCPSRFPECQQVREREGDEPWFTKVGQAKYVVRTHYVPGHGYTDTEDDYGMDLEKAIAHTKPEWLIAWHPWTRRSYIRRVEVVRVVETVQHVETYPDGVRQVERPEAF